MSGNVRNRPMPKPAPGRSVRIVSLTAFERAGPAAIAAARAAGQDRSHGGQAARARGATQTSRRRYELAWQGTPTDPAAFSRDVLPAIASIPLNVLRERTGLSIRYVSLIRRGLRMPHRRWWSALAGPTVEARGTEAAAEAEEVASIG
jgi:hypothetical protein